MNSDGRSLVSHQLVFAIENSFTRETMRLFAIVLPFVLFALPCGAAKQPVAAVFRDTLVAPAALAENAGALAQQAGYSVRFVDVSDLTRADALQGASATDLLILPHGRKLPTNTVPTISGFIKNGGNVLALGVPLWDTPIVWFKDRWVSRADYDQALNQVPRASAIGPFERADTWLRSSDVPVTETRCEPSRIHDQPAWHVTVPKLHGWDTFSSPAMENAFSQGDTLTWFRAKGSRQTKILTIEWREHDGSRWIATVELTDEWKTFVLPPSEFLAWPSEERTQSRTFQPSNAVTVAFGLAVSHGNVPGTNDYWIAGLGTARGPFDDFEPPARMDVPHLEALAPSYVCYPVTTPVKLRPGFDVFEPIQNFKPPAPLLALHPRPQGAGFLQDRGYRWQPLLEAFGRNDDYRGLIAVLRTAVGGGVVAAFTPDDAAFYEQSQAKRLVSKTLAHMQRGLCLADGGAEFFTAFTNQTFRIGSQVLNQSAAEAQVQVRITAKPRKESRDAFSYDASLSVPAHSSATVQTNWTPPFWPKSEYVITTELVHQREVIDRLSHSLNCWKPKEKPQFIESRDGAFWLGGKRWKAHGINYMPSSGIGLKGPHFEFWIGKGAYDPRIIERDLRRIKGMGMNAVSVFIYRQSLEAQHLLDLLHQCEDLGLHVNLSLRPGTPMDFRWKEMRELIEHYRLWSNDTVFAYDLAWEPCHFNQAHQEKHYTEGWRKWVQGRYANIDAAMQSWSANVPEFTLEARGFDQLTVPTMKQLTADGPWRKMAADYRQFLDELLAEKYGEARRLVRTIDTNHAVSFRMQHAGDPTLNWVELLAYDFWGLREAVDIWAPEAYGRIGHWERVKPGHFTASYARLCDPNKPIIWAEAGFTVWDMKRMTQTPEKLAFTTELYANLYQMMIESRIDGVFFWWYPGGFRVGENSDFGVISPDGTDRDITRVIRRNGPRFLAAPKQPKPDYWIDIDRDRDARGLFGIHEAVQAEYWKAISQGKTPGLRWAKKPGE